MRTEEGLIEPVERKLGQYGELMRLVVGAIGEGSEDLQTLVGVKAQSRVTAMGLARGRPGTEQELGLVTGQIRRRLSVTAVRAQGDCLLARLPHVGQGAGQADRRRDWVRREERLMRLERNAQWVARVRGSGIINRGQFLLE